MQWKLTISGNFEEIPGAYKTLREFKLLIAHEYVEGQLIERFNMNYISMTDLSILDAASFGAHDIAPLSFTLGYADLGRFPKTSPPLPDLDKWENLDEIVVVRRLL